MTPYDGSIGLTRHTLHRLATHVLARRRWDVTGRFGLRLGPAGIATPAFGADTECIRIAGVVLIREVAGGVTATAINGSSLRELAAFAGTDIGTPFSSGDDTPATGDPDEPLHVDEADALALFDWYELGWRALDRVIAGLPASARPAALQLWPEHFDIGTQLQLPDGDHVNLGCSPGDGSVEEPYLYVGPWGPQRPGDPSYWNAAFGAVLRSSDLDNSSSRLDQCVAFILTGVEALTTHSTST